MQELKFERNIDRVFARADENCVWVNCGWTVPIPKDKAIEYVRNYNSNEHEGFFPHEGNVILTHGFGKITFSRQEADALISLIKVAYLGG